LTCKIASNNIAANVPYLRISESSELGESEVNSTQWSQAYPRRDRELGRLVFVSGIAKPYHMHNSTQTTTM